MVNYNNFTIIGGIFNRSGIVKAVFITGIFMSLQIFYLHYLLGLEKLFYIFDSCSFDDITSAFATVAFVALISV